MSILAADNDRDMLEYLQEQFNSEVYVCENCGHEEPTKGCDSSIDLDAYIEAFPVCNKSQGELFEAAYRAQATSPVFIVNDMLVKDADGEYFHLATRAAFKFFKLGRESWTN